MRDPLAKLDRANKHVQELSGLVRTFAHETHSIDAHPYFWENHEDTSGDIIIYAVATKEPPSEVWSPIIGDIAFNLRSALDQLIWELSERHTGAAPDPVPWDWRQIAFPVVRKPEHWKTNPLWAIDPALVTRIEGLQPYVTGQNASERELLAVLDELCNIDKHRQLHLVNTTIKLGDILSVNPFPGGPEIGNIGNFEVVSKEPARHLIGRAEIGRARQVPVSGWAVWTSDPQVHMDPSVAIDVVFEQGPPAYGGSVFQLLTDIGQAVENIIRAF